MQINGLLTASVAQTFSASELGWVASCYIQMKVISRPSWKILQVLVCIVPLRPNDANHAQTS